MSEINLDRATKADIFYRKRDTFVLPMLAKNSDNSDVNFAGYTAKMQIKNYKTGEVLLTASTATGEIVLTTGNIVITIPAEEMNLNCNVMVYDFQLTSSGSIISTWLYGRMIEKVDVTI